jgi:hypothetical protein
MAEENSDSKRIADIFEEYCIQKNYQIQRTDMRNDDLRLDISNLKERAIIIVYHTAKIVPQGSPNALRAELTEFAQNLTPTTSGKISDYKACATRYDIMLPKLQELVRSKLENIDAKVTIFNKPKINTSYVIKIQRSSLLITITQFSNGTLWLQGKTDALFDECCDIIEALCNPSEKEVISRFISSDESSVKAFSARYTPELIELAESNIKNSIGDVYEYLEPYDKKWFVASECLSMTEIPLPEYSPVVMPASKAFEGFAKKLLMDIGLFSKDHFKNKGANFNGLNDNTYPSRKIICEKDYHADSYLKKLSVCLDISRNFMMHSDDAKITKVETPEEARKKLDSIIGDTKDIFAYFNGVYKLN